MAEFLDAARDLLLSNNIESSREQFERVFSRIKDLQAVHSKATLDIHNIESIFTIFELGRIIGKIPYAAEKEDIDKDITALKHLIVTTIENTMICPNKNRPINAPVPYDQFVDLIIRITKRTRPKRTVSIITFNYDLAVEIAMACAGLHVGYAIKGSDDPKDCVPLLKLHGSLNWAIECNSKKIRPVLLADKARVLITNSMGALCISKILCRHLGVTQGDLETEPLIVPPSWNKTEYHSTLSDVWASAATHLSEADYIFVIGYSMPDTDSFFKNFYALGTSGGPPLRHFTVFNPEREDGGVNKRFRELLGPGALVRYEYKTFTFEKAIQHILGLFPEHT